VNARSQKRNWKLPLSLAGLAIVVATTVSAVGASAATTATHSPLKPTIVLEHGAWADGSSWDRVVSRLQKAGYIVDVPPNPLRGPASDSAYLASYLATITGPIVLVGHSYGGFVTTDAATGNPNVKALVYVDAFIPAQGDTLNSLLGQFPGTSITPAALNFVPSAGGVLDAYIKPALFRSILGSDLSSKKAAVLAATQEPIAAAALGEPSGAPAWTSIPSWDVIGTADHAIPVAAQKFMANRAHSVVTEVDASHLSLVSQPRVVTDVIESAAQHS